MLVDVCVAGWPLFVAGWPVGNFVGTVISSLSCCLSTLEVLILNIQSHLIKLERATNFALPQLTKLKQLTFVVYGPKDDSLIAFTSLIMASPKLEKFVLKADRRNNIASVHTGSEKALAFPLQHLKDVELCGYSGHTTEVELVEYFVENAVVLERIIIDPRDRPPFGPNLDNPEEEAIFRNLAQQQLKGLVPSHVELVLL